MQLFKADEICGVVGVEIDASTAFWLGYSVAIFFKKENKKCRLIIGKDNRNSSDMLEAAVSCGICCAGVDCLSLGIVSSPAVSYLTRKYSAIAGIMITASCKEVQYNGFKIFDECGYVISIDQREKINEIYNRRETEFDECGRIFNEKFAVLDYISFLEDISDCDLSGLNIYLNPSNGVACEYSKKVFEKNNAKVVIEHNDFDGERINIDLNQTELNRIKNAVIGCAADVGFVFSADADRCLVVDERGELIDENKLVYLISKYFKYSGRLMVPKVVGTIFSSLSLEESLNKLNIDLIRANSEKNGIVSLLLKEDSIIGIDFDGRIVLKEFLPISDGVLTALVVSRIIKSENKKMSDMISEIENYFCIKKSYNINEFIKLRFKKNKELKNLIFDLEKSKRDAKIIAKPSETQDLYRIQIEGHSKKRVKQIFERLDKKINQLLMG